MRPLPPIEVLRARYTYDPDTGEVRHRHTRGGVQAGDPVAPTPSSNGYRMAKWRQGGKRWTIPLSRIAYALHHGADPYPYEIDHINHDTSDNRACNLRAVTAQQNSANRHLSCRRPVRITYPDGRGSIVCDSIATAGRVLRANNRRMNIALTTGRCLLWAHPTLPHTYTPSGITLAYT